MKRPSLLVPAGLLLSVLMGCGTDTSVPVTDLDERLRWPGGFIYGPATIGPWKAWSLAQRYPVLTLLNVSELSTVSARGLVVRYEDTFLTLPALERLGPAAARALARRPGYLRLWGLKSLTPEVAAGLVSRPGQTIELTGVTEISPEVARALAKGKRSSLWLGLTSLPVEVAAALADFPGDLSFENLDTVSLEAVTAMQKHRGELDLGKAKISTAVAEALLLHEGKIALMGAKRLEPGVGDILARHKPEVNLLLEEIDSVALARKLFSQPNGPSSVGNLRTISPEIAAEYARESPGSLESLDSLSLDAAAELARSTLEFDFPALTRLTPELAKILTDRKPALYLSGIKSLEGDEAVRVAEVLASTPAPVYLEFLERVSADALAALRKKPTIKLPPKDKLTIVP